MLHFGSERSKGDYCAPLQLQRPVVLNGTRASKGISLCPLKGDSVQARVHKSFSASTSRLCAHLGLCAQVPDVVSPIPFWNH